MARTFRIRVATTVVMMDGEDPNIKEVQYEGREGEGRGRWKLEGAK